MRTEITIPFAFDTAPIEEMLQRDGEKEAMRILENVVNDGIKKALPKKSKYTYDGYGRIAESKPEVDWKAYIDRMVNRFLDAHHDEIVDEAALLLAARASRKKPWRDVLAEIKAESE